MIGDDDNEGVEAVLPEVAVTEVGDRSADRPGGLGRESPVAVGLDLSRCVVTYRGTPAQGRAADAPVVATAPETRESAA